MKQLKVICGATSADTRIFVDDTQIGLVQEIKVQASVEGGTEVEIVFPDLFPFEKTNELIIKSLSHYIELLKDIPNVKVTLQALNFKKE